MIPVQITAHLATPMQAYEDWTPSLDALLEWAILDEAGLASANPTPEDVERSRSVVDAAMPLLKAEIGGEWYWAVSSPQYLLLLEQQDRLRKRWDQQEHYLDWQGKRQSWSTSEGHTKSYDLPQYLRTTDRIDWFAVGDLDVLRRWLTVWRCGRLGKKRRAIVWRWDVQEVQQDWHLMKDGVLMRPIPAESMLPYLPCDFALLNWGWRPPAWLPSNKARCAMPIHSVVKV
ncbi:MAG: hypothetical protein SNJ57_18810 [Cyanobacteriota bacterium]